MTREQLIAKTAETARINKAQAGRALNAILSHITNTLKAGGKVGLVGFGTFSTVKRAVRQGRNPGTRQPINIPAATIPKFKAGKKLKDAVAR